MSIIETLASGILVLNIGKALYDCVTGQTITQKLDKVSVRLEEVARHIYYLAQQEVWDTSVSKQRTIDDLRHIGQAARPLQKVLGTDLVISKPIISPDRLQAAFRRNPEEIFFDIRPLRSEGIPVGYMNDHTMVPVTFTRWGQGFMGLIKVGYAKDYLDCEYKTQNHLILPTRISQFQPEVRFKGPRNTQLWNQMLEIIADQLGVNKSKIKYESRFTEDLGTDSLDNVELLMAFEELFDVEIRKEDEVKMLTVGDVYRYVERILGP